MDKIIDLITNLMILIFGDKLLSVINDKISIDKWEKAFEEATSNFERFGKGFGVELSKHRSILRFYFATFNKTSVQVTVENIAIAITMEFNYFGINIDKEYIYDLSEAILSNWYNILMSNNYLREKYSSQIEAISYKKNADVYDETLKILNNKYELNKAFFMNYNSSKSATKIRIWLPKPNQDWIEWDSNHCIDIYVNPMSGFELGFLRVGFDYYIVRDGGKKEEHLRVAFYTSSQRREGAEFSTQTIGETSGNIIWAL